MKNMIPLLARIAAIADTFDAMTSKRSYRDALSIDVAKNEIKRCSGTQFDPELVDAFMELFETNYNEILEIPIKYH